MKSLIIYYSLSGKTKLVCEQIAKNIKADIEALDDSVNRKGFLGFMKSGFQAFLSKEIKLRPLKHNINDYSGIIISTPTWAGRPCPAVSTFLKKNDFSEKKLNLIATFGGNGTFCLKFMEKIAKENKGEINKKFGIKTSGVKDKELIKKADEISKEI